MEVESAETKWLDNYLEVYYDNACQGHLIMLELHYFGLLFYFSSNSKVIYCILWIFLYCDLVVFNRAIFINQNEPAICYFSHWFLVWSSELLVSKARDSCSIVYSTKRLAHYRFPASGILKVDIRGKKKAVVVGR